MPKYIDKDALLNKMQDRHDDLARDYGDYDNYVTGFGDAIELLENAPVADVQEVKHGKWDEIRIRDAYGNLICWIHRDCGRMSMGEDKYCPKCGALMQEDE